MCALDFDDGICKPSLCITSEDIHILLDNDDMTQG